ncbi:MAG: SMC family ATPase [Lachnospiraceae bacterium]|nr:SMC family ATPase [Lachnospiraceae bacterium]
MKPICVEFQAFGPYSGHEIINFEDISSKGLFLICGKTGTGKTTILDAITFALYGKSSGNVRDDFSAMRCTNAADDVATFVKFVFENNGKKYLFERRSEKRRKNFSDSYNAEILDEDGTWQPLFENPKSRDLDNKAEEIIGLNYSQFIQVIILPQGKFEKFLTSGSDEKEKILTSIFGEEMWKTIADKMVEEADIRLKSIREIQSVIKSSLSDEGCESIEDLSNLIAVKKTELNELNAGFDAKKYAERNVEITEALALSKRFLDFERIADQLKELEEKKNERDLLEEEAKRASKALLVKPAWDETARCESEFQKRSREEKQAAEAVKNHEQVILSAQNALENHNMAAEEAENNKKLSVSYSLKRDAYGAIDKAYAELNKAEQERKTADALVKKAVSEAEKKAKILNDCKNDYELLLNEQRELLDSYLKGITGELAEKLEDNTPCPVCGSLNHPKKAVKTEGTATKQDVDDKKNECEDKYKELDSLEAAYKEASDNLEQSKSTLAQTETLVVKLTTEYSNYVKEKVEGISSLAVLEQAILKLDKSVSDFEIKKNELTESLNRALNDFSGLKADAQKASDEVKAANKALKKANENYIKAVGDNGFASPKEVEDILNSNPDVDAMKKKVADYDAAAKQLGSSLKAIQSELKGLKKPDRDELLDEQRSANEANDTYNRESSVLTNEIERLSNKLKKLEKDGKGLFEKANLAETDLSFAKKLRGDSGTGLQRYVLGIMFSSVITAANKMLEMVHGGRYQLFRTDDKAQGSNKRGLELKVYDKYSAEHDGRFVSTLSGGEKFLTSLALSIGMSSVAQKSGIRIEALFIDEGFGSLDEDSIEDAMAVLESIQKASGLVGIISHVQLLQERIPIKLRVKELGQGSTIEQTVG